jgi:hypothetical protein
MKRKKSEWTLGGVGLWLIAAILATVFVCSRSGPPPDPPEPAIEVEVEVVE